MIQEQQKAGIPTLWTRDFIILCLSNFLLAVAFYFLIAVLPIYITEVLKADKSKVGMIIASYTLAALLIRPFTGFALDTIGRKWIYLSALLIFGLMFGIYAAVVTLTQLLLLRLFHGFAWGVTSTSTSTIVADILPVSRRGEGIGYFGVSMTLAMAFSPVVGLAILGKNHYNQVFFTGLSLIFLAFLINFFFVKFPVFNKKEEEMKFSWKKLIEKKSLPVSLDAFFFAASYGGIVSFIMIYSKENGISRGGFFFVVYAILLALSRIFSGRMFDRKGARLIVSMGTIMTAAGFFILAIFKDYSGYLCSAGLIGLGYGMIFPSFQTMINNVAENHQRGAANSTFFSALDLGIGAGSLGAGYLALRFKLSDIYILFSAIIFLSIFIHLFWINKHYEKNKVV